MNGAARVYSALRTDITPNASLRSSPDEASGPDLGTGQSATPLLATPVFKRDSPHGALKVRAGFSFLATSIAGGIDQNRQAFQPLVRREDKLDGESVAKLVGDADAGEKLDLIVPIENIEVGCVGTRRDLPHHVRDLVHRL